MDIIEIFGTKIYNITLEETLDKIREFINGESLKVIFTPNTEIVMAAKDDNVLRDIINQGDLIVPDGIGLIYASRIKKKPLKERVTGYDISMNMLNMADENSYSLYLLGGKEGIAQIAKDKIEEKYKHIKVAGYHHGYFKGSHNGYTDHDEENKIIDEINSKNPDIIFLGLGFPKQEIWIDANKSRLKGKVIIGNGGVIDVLSGNTKRAPEIFLKLNLEWFYRLIKEPSRIRRQMALPKFMFKVIFSKNVIK
ncbi:MAG: WecB/TagA/CpsF family glycosyltransferase [Tissierellaceae bacterium]|nr:WecB/TagA/CpsF family glycosyltransferase [Tissierellaceae bacterium]